MNLREPGAAVLLSCGVAGALHLVAWTTPGRSLLWGLHHAAFLPPWVAACLLLVMLFSLVPPSASHLIAGFQSLARNADRLHSALLPLGFGAIVLTLFLLLPVEHGLLGDSDGRLAEVAADQLPGLMFRPHASDTVVRHTLHHSVGTLLGWTAARSYATISSAWGLVLLVAGWHVCRQLSPSVAGRWLLFVPLTTSGYMLLFFGYIETYSSVAALGLVLLAATLGYARGKVGLWLPVAVWCLLCVHHLLGGLAGSCLVLAVVRRHQLDRFLPGFVASRLPVVVSVSAGLAAWLFFLVVRPTSAIPLFVPYDHIPYTLLHPAHLAETANFVGLSALPAVVMLGAAWLCQPGREGRDSQQDLVVAAAGSTAMLMFITNPALGRLDWDLMAMHAPLWILAGGVCLERALRGHAAIMPKAALAMSAVSLLHTVPWIALQQSPQRLIRSIETMAAADPHVAGSRALKLGVRFEQLGYPQAAMRQYERAILHNPEDALALYNMGRVQDQWGQLDAARQLYEQAVALDTDLPKVWNNLGAIYLRQQSPAEAVRALERAVVLEPDFVGGWNNLGTAYYDQNRFADAARAYERAASSAGEGPDGQPDSQPDSLPDHLYFNLGVAHARAGDFAAAAAALEIFVQQNPASLPGLLQLGDAYARSGKRVQARRVLQRYVEIAPADDPARQRATQYLQQTEASAP